MFFVGTILFVTLIGIIDLGGIIGGILGTNDYLYRVCFSQVEFAVPLIAFVYINEKK